MIDILQKLNQIKENNPDIDVTDAIKGAEMTQPQQEGRVKDAVIGAEEILYSYQNEDGDLKMSKADVIADLQKQSAESKDAGESYSYQIAQDMVEKDYHDDGQKKPDMDMNSEQPTDEGNKFAQAVQQAKASGMKPGDKFKVGDQEHTLRDSDFEQVNTNTMSEDKKTVNEAIQITTDSPEEAGVMMQILKLAGVQPVSPEMMGMEKPEEDPAHDQKEPEHMRDIINKMDGEEQADETYANTPDEKVDDVDTLVNKHSGGMNSQKLQVRKEYPGDNPLAVKEEEVTEEDLANRFRTAYEQFKENYQAEAKSKPDYIDLDKDGNKTEPMKKAAQDAEKKKD